jgi:histidyl-tRNA synthetase
VVLGGPPTPAVGYGLGLERVLLAMRDEGLDPEAVPEVHRLDCFVVAVGAADGDYARDVTERLRAAGLRTDRLFDPSPMKRQFRAAARAGARFAVVVGESELKEDRITARRLDDGEERTLGVDEGIAWIREPVSP